MFDQEDVVLKRAMQYGLMRRALLSQRLDANTDHLALRFRNYFTTTIRNKFGLNRGGNEGSYEYLYYLAVRQLTQDKSLLGTTEKKSLEACKECGRSERTDRINHDVWVVILTVANLVSISLL
jgi:hypothetical protein